MRMRMMKTFLVVFLAFCSVFMMGTSSCEQKAAHDVGVDTATDPATGKQVVTQVPVAQSPAGQAAGVVSGIINTVAPGPIGGLTSIAANVLLGIAASFFYNRAKKSSGQQTLTQAALNVANDGLQATGAAIQQATNLLPPDHAATLNRVLTVVHKAMDIAPEIQHMIQPDLSTAGVHADAPPSAPPPAPKA